MNVNINLNVVSFGQVVFKINQPGYNQETVNAAPERQDVYYLEPLETAPPTYEIYYEDELINYIVPSATA